MTESPQPMRLFPVLTTDRLLLREFSLEDAPAVYEIFSRQDFNQWLETEPLQSLVEAETRVRDRMSLFHNKMGFRWAITLCENPSKIIGSCGYFHVRRGTQTYEAGFDLHPDHWRQGLMTEALRAVLAYSFSAQALLPVHRIEAIVMPDNTASIRLLEKLGFIREGVRREFGFWKGRYQDVFLYALLIHKQ